MGDTGAPWPQADAYEGGSARHPDLGGCRICGAARVPARAAFRRQQSSSVSAEAGFWYPGLVKSSVSIVLFFLLSAFFLTALLGALERSRKLVGIAGGCLAGVVLIIVLLTPVELPSWRLGLGGNDDKTSGTTTRAVSSSTTVPGTAPTSVSVTTWSSVRSTTTTAFYTGTTIVTPYTTVYQTVTTEVTGG